MANNFIFPEWLAENSVRAFPLSQTGSRKDITGTVTLSDSLLVAAAINTLPEGYADGTFFISRLLSYPDFVAVDVGFKAASGTTRVVCRIMATSAHIENTAYPILGIGEDASVSGSITIGDITQTQREIIGLFDFEADSTPFDADCLFVSVPAVKYIEIFNGSTSLGKFTDVIRIRSGQNIRLRYVDPLGDVIAIDAINGLNLVSPDQCEKLPVLGKPIRTINGVGGDENQNLQLEGTDCVGIDGILHGLQISNACATPCCGCNELASLVEAQREVEAQQRALRDQIQEVRSNQTEMITNLVSGLTQL